MLALLYMTAFLAAGIDAGNRIFPDRPWRVRLWLGAALGLAAQIWLPAMWAFALGYGPAAHALSAATGLGLWLWVRLARRGRPEPARPEDRRSLRTLLTWSAPLMVLMTALFMGHVLAPGPGGLYAGQSTYGDLNLHLGIVSSIAEQRVWPPEYSILPGTRLSYPFLVDSHSASLMLLGLPLRWAVIAPSLVMTALCFAGFHLFLEDRLGCARRTALACLLFFMTGGLGFLFFLNGAPAEGSAFRSIFTAFYRTPTNFLDLDLRWVNVLCDMMLPQRTTLLGWTMLPACLYLAWKGPVQGSRRDAAAGGALAGLLPMMHTHTFLALGVVCGGWLVAYWFRQRDKKAYLLRWLLYAAAVAVLALPQLLYWTFRQAASEGFLRFSPGWVIGADSPLWFWVKNAGLPFLFIAPAVWARWREHLPWYLGAIAIFALSHLFLFQPNPYDNNKLLYVWYLFTAALVADYLIMLWDRMAGVRGRAFLAGVCAVALFASGVLTVGRELNSNCEYRLYADDEIAAAEYLRQTAPADALIVTSDQHTNAIASLSGRNIYVGTEIFLFYHGLNYAERRQQVEAIYRDPEGSAALLAQIGADYVLISDYERYGFGIREGAFDSAYPIAFRQGNVTLYAVSPRAQSAMQ
ncbi:MAG: hypothetical protein ACOX7W_04690 [Christensenellales bacterium]|jgi:hypothetical protein